MARRAELQRRLAGEFANQGWPYDHEVGPAILDELERRGTADGAALVGQVAGYYLERHGITREQMASVLDRALGGERVQPSAPAVTTLVVNDNRHSIQITDSTVRDSQLNTGQQLVVNTGGEKPEVLAAVAALIRGGLVGEWNEDAARDLAEVIDQRDDITVEDVREIAKEVAEEEGAEPGKVKVLIERIATGAISGALGTGISAGLGGLF
jgi:hypothetical protein